MNLQKIPEALKELNQWVNWKLIPQGKGPDKKLPLRTDGTPASSSGPETWTTIDNAASVADRFSGIGFVFSPNDPFCGIDFDGCRNPL